MVIIPVDDRSWSTVVSCHIHTRRLPVDTSRISPTVWLQFNKWGTDVCGLIEEGLELEEQKWVDDYGSVNLDLRLSLLVSHTGW